MHDTIQYHAHCISRYVCNVYTSSLSYFTDHVKVYLYFLRMYVYTYIHVYPKYTCTYILYIYIFMRTFVYRIVIPSLIHHIAISSCHAYFIPRFFFFFLYMRERGHAASLMLVSVSRASTMGLHLNSSRKKKKKKKNATKRGHTCEKMLLEIIFPHIFFPFSINLTIWSRIFT